MLARKVLSTLASIEIYAIGLAVLLSLALPNWLPLTVGAIIVFWIIRIFADGRLAPHTTVDLPILGLLLILPLNLWATSQPAATWQQVLRLLSGIGLFYAILYWAKTERRLDWISVGLSTAGLTLALFAPFSVNWSIGKLPVFPSSIYAPFKVWVADAIHPNVMAGALVFLLPIPLGVLIFYSNKQSIYQRVLCSVACLVMTAILLLTQSRSAWLALACALAILACLRWRRSWIVVALVAIFAVITIGVLGYQNFTDALFAGSSSAAPSGITERLEIWRRAIYMIEDFPFTGVGMGAFGPVADALYPSTQFAPGVLEHAHNLFLQVAVDLGLPGLFFYVWLMAIITWQAIQTWRNRGTDKHLTCLVAGLLASQAALVVHGLLDAVLWGMVRSAPLVWALWGVIIALRSWQIRSTHPST